MGFIAIIDYGAGNLMSVVNALNFLGYENVVTSNVGEICRAERIILPGVGAFPSAIENLREKALDVVLREQAAVKPFLGICLGMQMLFERSFEIEECEGLGLIPGAVRRIKTDLKLPHIGWNSLEFANPSPLLNDVPEGTYVYYVHSFCAETERENLVAASDYGECVAGIVSSGSVFGCQFHPEKSGEMGLRILKNFCEVQI